MCIEHNLTQQGYTLLQETMISEVVEKQFGSDTITNRKYREIVEDAIHIKYNNIPEEKWKEETVTNREDVTLIIGSLNNDFVRRYNEISQRRNDINHAGFRYNPQKPDSLMDDLKKYYIELKAGDENV